MSTDISEVAAALIELEEDRAIALAQEQLDAGADPVAVLEELRRGMQVIGERFESKEYFLSELVMAAEIFKNVGALLEPRLALQEKVSSAGIAVVGTVQGDIHDIGKNIVATMLKCSGFDVHDLGVDVPPGRFVETVQQTGPAVIGLSALLTTSFDSMKATVQALTAAGLRDKVSVLLGGGPVNEQVRSYVGADAWGRDAMEAVRLFQAHAAKL